MSVPTPNSYPSQRVFPHLNSLWLLSICSQVFSIQPPIVSSLEMSLYPLYLHAISLLRETFLAPQLIDAFEKTSMCRHHVQSPEKLSYALPPDVSLYYMVANSADLATVLQLHKILHLSLPALYHVSSLENSDHLLVTDNYPMLPRPSPLSVQTDLTFL